MALHAVTSGVKRALWGLPQVQTLYYRRRARQAVAALDLARPPILVYQMAKVGSATVTRTLEAIGLDRDIHHLHFMMPDRLEAAREEHAAGDGVLPYDWCLGQRLGERLRKAPSGVQVPVVTLVRDPIARFVSGIYQLPWLAKPGIAEGERLSADDALAFLEREAARDDVWLGPERWFDRELREMFGIDVFALPFAKTHGYAFYRSSRARVLLLRMEDLDDTLGPALAEFLELPEPPKLIRRNERRRSEDGDAYAEVLERFRLPRETVERIYTSRLPRHFYDDATLRRFTERWSR